MGIGRLHERTLYLLRHRPRALTYERIAELLATAPGPRISRDWLAQMASGRIKVLCVDRCQSLYELLSGEMLEINFSTSARFEE